MTLADHYWMSVQPPDPASEWPSPPFEPTTRDDNVYARGAVDDKGHVMIHLKALMRARDARLPVNVRVLVQGKEKLAADHEVSEILWP